MQDDSRAILDSLLSEWHHYCLGFSPVQKRGADPVFKLALRAKGGQTLEAISEDQEYIGRMESTDFEVSEMPEPHRSAIYSLARNCYTGKSVWTSPRLPADALERGRIVGEARSMLTKRLISAGVL